MPDHRPVAAARTDHEEPVALGDPGEFQANVRRIAGTPWAAIAEVRPGHPIGNRGLTVRFPPSRRVAIVTAAVPDQITASFDRWIGLA